MTERLYYTDDYLRDFDATVVGLADEGRRVYLDRTAFYPTSGGQPFDTGYLGGIEVFDVVDEGDRIAEHAAKIAGQSRAAFRRHYLQSGLVDVAETPGGRLVVSLASLEGRNPQADHDGKHVRELQRVQACFSNAVDETGSQIDRDRGHRGAYDPKQGITD